MPELPEVETVKRTLDLLVKGKKISEVQVRLPRIIIKPDDPRVFEMMLKDQTIHVVERRGKFLRFICDDYVWVSHLRMEGRYGCYPSTEPLETHTHVIFHFYDGSQLRYKDVRQFGTMHLFPIGEDLQHKPLNQLGIEPLDESFTCETLRTQLAHRHAPIKPLLLNQAYVVGIGNIYADEALFLAKIHPERQASSLTGHEYEKLHQAIVTTLHKSVEAGGSSIKSYVNGQGEIGLFQYQLHMYGRQQLPCVSCGTVIEKIFLRGRGTHYCPQCQHR
jgi:formamidopyrimidine-DNA glycosylase